MWGGRTKDFSKKNSKLASSIHCFDPSLESWTDKKCSGDPPPGIYGGACASSGHYIYVYGGYDGSEYQSSLHQLDTKSLTWKQLSSTGPMRKGGCGMVAYDNKLVLFGGYGCPSSPTRPEVVDARHSDELHIFDLKLGEGEDRNLVSYGAVSLLSCRSYR